jgi:hypothetical protein
MKKKQDYTVRMTFRVKVQAGNPEAAARAARHDVRAEQWSAPFGAGPLELMGLAVLNADEDDLLLEEGEA